MKTIAHLLVALMLVCAASCSKTELKDTDPGQSNNNIQNANTRALDLSDPVGIDYSQLQLATVYFNWHTFTIQIAKVINEPVFINPALKREPAQLFVYDVRSTVPGIVSRTLVPISSTIGDDNNSILWSEVKIRFNPGFTPKQFYSLDQVITASQGIHPSITLNTTGVVYEGKMFDLVKGNSSRPTRM